MVKRVLLVSVTKLHTLHTLQCDQTGLVIELYTYICIDYWNEDSLYNVIRCVSDESKKEDLVRRHLWEKSNMERYIAETRKESKRRR